MNDYGDKTLAVYNKLSEIGHRGIKSEADGKTINPSKSTSDDNKKNIYYPKHGEKIDPDKDLRIMNQRDLKAGIVLMFAYHPKWKEELPFYDVLPMPMLFGVGHDRFIGFNLHYLQLFPSYKASLLRLLTNQKRGAGGFSYRRMKRFFGGLPPAVLKYCVKEYLYSHIVSKVKFVPEAYYIDLLNQVSGDFKKMSPVQIRQWILSRVSK